jgi:hypothetical protein
MFDKGIATGSSTSCLTVLSPDNNSLVKQTARTNNHVNAGARALS